MLPRQLYVAGLFSPEAVGSGLDSRSGVYTCQLPAHPHLQPAAGSRRRARQPGGRLGCWFSFYTKRLLWPGGIWVSSRRSVCSDPLLISARQFVGISHALAMLTLCRVRCVCLTPSVFGDLISVIVVLSHRKCFVFLKWSI